MAEIITRLVLQSGEYENKIKRSTQGLLQMEQECRKAGTSLNNISKNNMEYVRSLGQMQTVSNTARGKLNELSSAFTEFSVIYKHLTDEEKKGDIGKALSASLDQLKVRIEATKNDLQEVDEALGKVKKSSSEIGDSNKGGGLFSNMGSGLTDMMAVFGGNMLTKGVTMLTSELAQSVGESIELARQGEGIRAAFERLNQPGLLDNLKAATHGTVSEIELMKQAIKFENFKLPLEDLKTYLAFAQQKAKDTGDSIDYLVDSIVSGLGRQSKQILDNLGISASELTKRMDEGATMTEAVADIIREEMSKAGDYVETAADRAARATADAQNKMEEFGRTAMPIAEEWAETWAILKNGAMEFAQTILGPVAESIKWLRWVEQTGGIDWDKIYNSPDNISGPNYKDPSKQHHVGNDHVRKAQGGYVEVTDSNGRVIRAGSFKNEEEKQKLINGPKITGIGGGNRRTGRTGSKTTPPPTPDELASKEVEQAKERYRQEVVKATQNYANGMATEEEYQKKINDTLKQLYDAYNTIYAKYGRGTEAENMELLAGQISENNKPTPRPVSMDGIITAPVSLGLDEKEMEAFSKKIKDYFKKNPLGDAGKSVTEEWQNAAKAIQAVGSAMSGIEDPAAKVLGTIAQAVATIALGYAEATKQAATMGPWAWVAFAATGLATMISSISAVKSATSGFAQGGIVPGNSFNDQLRTSDYGISSGELILNRAQQGIIASQLEGGGMRGMVLDTQISAEAIRIVLNNNGRRTRRGEYVTTKKYGS